MHIIIGIIAAIAAILFYASRISRGASDLVDTANEIGNLPRRLRHRRNAGKHGLDLVSTPVEAATVLMISVSRLDKFGRVTDKQARAMSLELQENMQLDPDYAGDLIIQMRSLSQHLVQAESTLFPMIKVLQNNISKDDGRTLAEMLRQIANIENMINTSQKEFIRRFEERMGLLG